MATAILAAGQFWGVEYHLGQIAGVTDTEVGYAGGHVDAPIHQQVSEGTTGHAMAVRITYDPEEIAYESLLEAFFALHDPTQADGQGPNKGSQYRSAIFCETAEQRLIAERVKQRLEASGRYRMPIVTEIRPAVTFWKAEEFHQRFVEKSCGCVFLDFRSRR